jgi:ketosteroid isomerase-like protein
VATTEDSNVELVRRWFEAAATGDVQTALSILSPALSYYGYDFTGEARQFADRDDFFAMCMQSAARTDEFTTEVVNAFPVGRTLVMVHARAHRRARESREAVDDDFIIAFRVHDGQITHGMDLCGPELLDFWKRNGGT